MDGGSADQFSWARRGLSPHHSCHKGTISREQDELHNCPVSWWSCGRNASFLGDFHLFFRLTGGGKQSFSSTTDDYQGNLTVLTVKMDFQRSPGVSELQKAELLLRARNYSFFPRGGSLFSRKQD